MRILVILCVFAVLCVLLYFTVDAALLARSQYSEGPATGHLDTGFSRFPSVYKQMLRRFPTFQVAITCFSCSPPDLNLIKIIIIIKKNNIFIYCNWVVTRWQWLFYMYEKYEIGY